MKFIADFHLHSKYSRATSRNMDLESLDKWAKIKGIKVLGTGDFTHPEWFKFLKEKLEPAEAGLFKFKKGQDSKVGFGPGASFGGDINLPAKTFLAKDLKNSDNEIRFILTSEISCIYSKGGRVRKVHIIVFSPSFDICEKINTQLGWIGNLKSDGRPILGLDAKELLKIVLNVSKDCLVVPAHVWTPHFSVFGSNSGFNSLEECFEEYSKYIYAIETGLSSSPSMNWRVSALDKISLISNSDSHSPQKIGREANVFDTEISYRAIVDAIKTKNPQKFLYTIEFFPEEGKYHYDGHRICGVRTTPQESKKYNNICPVCGKPLTIGVLNRIEKLADRPEGFNLQNAVPFKSLIPLEEIIADVLGQTVGTKTVIKEYENLIEKFGNEFEVLLDASFQNLERETLPEIAEGIIKVREGKVMVEPGYDGVYGKINVFGEGEKKQPLKQSTLF